jgi:hypothetical protein
MSGERESVEAAMERLSAPGPVRERYERAAIDTMPCDCGACTDHCLTIARTAVGYALDHIRAALGPPQESGTEPDRYPDVWREPGLNRG